MKPTYVCPIVRLLPRLTSANPLWHLLGVPGQGRRRRLPLMRRGSRNGLGQGLWFVALWALGVGVLGAVAYLLRGILKLAGG